MDLSKLPRLSKTEAADAPRPVDSAADGSASAPAPPPVVAGSFCSRCGAPLRPGARFCDSCGSPTVAPVDYARPDEPGGGAEAWISIVMGLVLIFMSPRIWQYLLMRGSFTWEFQDEQGNPLAYTKTVFFWGDVALAAFALTLIAEGVVIAFTRRPALIAAAFGLTVVTTLLNFLYVAWMVTKGYGLQLFPALAVAFGGYIAVYEWRLWQQFAPRSRS